MGKNKFCFIVVLLLSVGFVLHSKPSATQGRHFVIGFMQNEIYRTDLTPTFYLSIFISPLRNDTVTVSIPGLTPSVYLMSAGQIREIAIDKSFEITNIGVNRNKLIDITSKSPIIVWAYSSKNQSSDAYVALPVSIWGDEYRVVSMGNDMYNGRQRLILDNCIDSLGRVLNETKYKEQLTPRSSEFLVMASFDSTIVEYFPTCNTRNGVAKGDTGRVILNAGDCFLVQGEAGALGTNDLTGTLVLSSNPVGVVSGHMRTSVRQGLDHPYDTKDHIVDMLPPIRAWGKNFVSVPFVDGQNVSTSNYRLLCNSGDLIKIIAAEDNTRINYSVQITDSTLEDRVATIRYAGDFIEIEVASPTIWSSDKPIMVSQLMMHKGYEGESYNYDPAIIVLTPIEQYIEETTFTYPNNNRIANQYIAHCFIAITDSVGIYNLNFNNARLNESTANVWGKRIGNSKYYWLMKVFERGTHTINAVRGNFSGIIYGHGPRDSYAMTLGKRLNDPYNVDTIPPLISVDSACGVFRIRISDVKNDDANATGIEWGTVNNIINYDISEFVISDTATVIDIVATPIDTTQDGSFRIEFTDKNLNVATDNFRYTGFNVERPTEHNFGMLKWNSPTEATLRIRNNGTGIIRLLSMQQSADSRIKATIQQNLPHIIYRNDSLEIEIIFTPDASLNPVDTKIGLTFECNKIEIPLIGKISAPGLLADDLDFGKVRLYDTKTLSGKIHNAGNISIVISNVKKDIEEVAFEWSFNKSFPSDVAIDDSINFSVNFTPTEERNYIVNSMVENDNDIDCDFYVKGIGGRPKIENIEIDWGKRRIGTENDTTIYIVNAGSFNDTINYKTEISITHNSDLSADSIKKIQNIIIGEQDSVIANYSFIPADKMPLENVFELASKWTYHNPITATFKAQGTIPEYEAYNYDFGEVPILSNILHHHNCVFSFGNEALTIDSIVLIGGDANSFEIDYEILYDLFIDPNEYLKIPITFAPTFKGEHKIFLEITHDANPNYIRTKDTIEIYGICITENSDLIVDLEIPMLHSCVTEEALLNIKNIGEASIIIDSVLLIGQPDIFYSAFKNNPANQLPLELQHNENISFPINIYAERDKIGTLTTEIFYNSENKIVVSKPIEPITSTIISTATSTLVIPTNTILPGDTLYLICQSNISQKSENNFEYKINLNVNKTMLFCLQESCYISINNNGTNYSYSVNVTQYIDKIEFSLPTDFFEINGNATFQFELPFLVLLAAEKETTIEYELISDRCYYSGASNLDVKVSPVCMDSTRLLVFDGFPYASINQNPTNDEIDLTINLLEKDTVSVVIYDLLGNEVHRIDDNIYEKGKHNIKIKLTDISNSIYFVQTKSNTINTTQKIVVQR